MVSVKPLAMASPSPKPRAWPTSAPLGNGYRDDLMLEEAVLSGGRGALMGCGGELVLLAAGEIVGIVGQCSHGLVGEEVTRAVVGEVVCHRDIALLEAGARLRKQVRCLRYRLLAARHDHLDAAGADQLIGQQNESIPDRHTLLIVSAGTDLGMPPATAACRAGSCPVQAASAVMTARRSAVRR